EAEAGRALVAAERTAERERRATHALAVAHRQPALAALEAHAHGDAPAFAAGAGRVDRHVEHGRAHRAHAVDAAVLAVQAAVELVEAVLQHGHAVVEPARVEADQLLDRRVGVAVGRAQRGRVAAVHVLAERHFAVVRIRTGRGQGGGVARLGDLAGNGLHLRLGQAVPAAGGAGRSDQRRQPVVLAAGVAVAHRHLVGAQPARPGR